MRPDQLAKLNLTDYHVEVISQVIQSFESTATLRSGTRLWRSELLCDGKLVDASEWQESLHETAMAAETLLICQERALEKEAEENVDFN